MIVMIDADTEEVHNFPEGEATIDGVAEALKQFAADADKSRGKLYLSMVHRRRDLAIIVVEGANR